MNGTMTTLKIDGTIVTETVTAQPGLQRLQSAVGGDIEMVPMFDTWDGRKAVAFCNEYGKIHHLPVNRLATRHWQDLNDHRIDDMLVGDVVILTGDDAFMETI